jgi:hypothetical protein
MRFKRRVLILSASFLLLILLQLPVLRVAAYAPPGGNDVRYHVYGYVKSQATGAPISGAAVALYADGAYKGTVYTSSTGYFSQYFYAPRSAEIFEARVSKSGYQTRTVYGSPDSNYNVNFGTIYLSPAQISYFIHGYVKNGFNESPISGASVVLYRDVYEGWSQIGSTATNQNGYYSCTYNTYDQMSQCRVVASASGYYDSANTVGVTGTDVNMGTLHMSTYLVRYAVIVGISDYQYANDLSYCDEDATDWYNYLTTAGGYQSSNVWVYGDSHSGNYPKYDGLATESNVVLALENMVAKADQNDIICFITSGHGGYDDGDPDGDVYLCMWNYQSTSENGKLRDSEIACIFADSVASKNFFFFDNCHSGGIGPEIMALDNAEHNLVCATASWEGYGYDYPPGNNGLFTYYFLELGLIGHFNSDPLTAMEYVFQWAHDNYPEEFEYTIGGTTYTVTIAPESMPEMYDGNPSAIFRI